MESTLDGSTLCLHNSDILFNTSSVKDINPFCMSPESPGPNNIRLTFMTDFFPLRRMVEGKMSWKEGISKQIQVHDRKKAHCGYYSNSWILEF